MLSFRTTNCYRQLKVLNICLLLIFLLAAVLVALIVENFDFFFPKYELDPLYKNICLNFKDPSTLTHQQKLSEFKASPCAPVTFTPGFAASRLRLEINCEQLQKNDPETFESCYWNTCEQSWSKFWPIYRAPAAEYDLWLPSTFSIISTFLPITIRDKCYYNLTKTVYNPKATSWDNFIIPRIGIRTTWYGNTVETKPQSNCGFDSVYDMAGIKGIVKKTSPYKKFLDTLEYLGYTNGLTMQIIPYDFRKNMKLNGHLPKFERSVSELHRITGKKVMVMAHSYGNIHVWHGLVKMDQGIKDRTVKSWIALHPPFGSGVATGIKAMVAGSNRLNFLGMGFGYWSYMSFMSQETSLYESFPTNAYEIFEGADFMRNITDQIRFEKDKGFFGSKKGISFWPDSWETCSRDYFYHNNCTTGLFNQSSTEYIRIENQGYTSEQLKEYLQVISFHAPDVNKKLWELTRNDKDIADIYDQLPNPGNLPLTNPK